MLERFNSADAHRAPVAARTRRHRLFSKKRRTHSVLVTQSLAANVQLLNAMAGRILKFQEQIDAAAALQVPDTTAASLQS